MHSETALIPPASKLYSVIMSHQRLSASLLAIKRIVAAFVRPGVSQETVEAFDEEFAKGRDIDDTWVVHPTRSHGTCTSSLFSNELEILG